MQLRLNGIPAALLASDKWAESAIIG